MATAAGFDPYQQNITVYTSPGSSVNISIPELDEWINYGVQISINYGAQIGASIILLVVLTLLTRADKRTSPIFIINTLSLFLNIIRNTLLCVYFTSPFNKSYAFITGDYSQVPRGAYAESVTSTVFEVLTLMSIEASLCLQVWVVCKTVSPARRMIIFILSAAIALNAIAFRILYSVKNAILILAAESDEPLESLGSTTNIVTTVSICWFSAVFVVKLGLALRTRRQLGLEKFGSMQVLFIMGCQTLFIPALFSILQYFVSTPSMSSEVVTAVVIFLPLSSLWAAASIEGRLNTSPRKDSRQNLLGSMSSASTAAYMEKRRAENQSMTLRELAESPVSSPCAVGRNGSFPDIEAQAQGMVRGN